MSIVIILVPVGYQQSDPKPESGTAIGVNSLRENVLYALGFLWTLMPYGQLLTRNMYRPDSSGRTIKKRLFYRKGKKLAQIQAGVFEDQYGVGLPRLLPSGNELHPKIKENDSNRQIWNGSAPR
jgi:hypothetical protein